MEVVARGCSRVSRRGSGGRRQGEPRAGRLLLRTALVVAVSLLASAPSGCSTPSLVDIAGEINQTRSAAFPLIPGDQLHVQLLGEVDYAQDLTIPISGAVPLLRIPEAVSLAGLTLEDARRRVSELYGKTDVRNPKVGLYLTAPAPREVVVAGMVENPGAIALGDDRVTLVEALGRAGGPLLDRARLSHLLLVRWDATQNRQLSWVIDARITHWGVAPPVYLQPHDVVYVPNTPIDEVDIFVDKYIRRLLPLPISPLAVP